MAPCRDAVLKKQLFRVFVDGVLSHNANGSISSNTRWPGPPGTSVSRSMMVTHRAIETQTRMVNL